MSKATFDGINKIITINSGITNINVKTDLYSDWKEWVFTSSNAKYEPAFRSVGGDELQVNYFLAPTFFLLNGWRIRPDESNHTLVVVGNLYVDGSNDSPFISTIGNYRVMINSTTSNVVNVIATGSGVTSQNVADIVDSVLAGVQNIENVATTEIISDIGIAKDEVLGAIPSAPSIVSGVQDALAADIAILKGLAHQNFRMSNQVYDSNNNLTSAKVSLYGNSDDCEGDCDPIYEYRLYATYLNGKLVDYWMKSI